MKISFFAATSALLLGATAFPALAQTTPPGAFFFRDGDRAMILGDSITEQRQYSTLVESYTLSRFPKWKITFRNTGWSGDRANFTQRGGQENGLKRDIFPLNPTAVTVDFGMNDARSGDAGLQTYIDTSRTLTDALTGAGARVALITSSPEEKYEADQPAGSAYNALLRKYSEGLKGVATEKNVTFVDQLNPMITTIEAGRAASVLSPAQGGPRLTNDGVHGNWAGHLIMAANILKGLNAPSLVSSVEIDDAQGAVGKPRITAQNGAVVTGFSRLGQTPIADETKIRFIKAPDWNAMPLTFTRTDGALPWPISPEAALALKIPGFTPLDDLSRYALKVVNLPLPEYEISIDDQSVGTFSREQLAAGINLSQNAGPISAQTGELFKKIGEKNNLFYTRWRQVQLFKAPAWLPNDSLETAQNAEMARLDAQIADAEAQIDVLRQPKPHVWSVKPVVAAATAK